MNYLVCSEFSLKAYSALTIRFKKMVEYYAFCSDHFLDDSCVINEVFSDKIYFQFPTKSGQNGAMRLKELLNYAYIYNPDGEHEVLREIPISGKKVLELRYCNNTSHLTLDYIKQREKYVGSI